MPYFHRSLNRLFNLADHGAIAETPLPAKLTALHHMGTSIVIWKCLHCREYMNTSHPFELVGPLSLSYSIIAL
jgi:hypothetical protein